MPSMPTNPSSLLEGSKPLDFKLATNCPKDIQWIDQGSRNHLETIKFICEDFWSEVFKKQIDNLKTNHRGTFVLQDNRFRWLAHMSVDLPMEASGSIQDPSAMADNKEAQATGMHLYLWNNKGSTFKLGNSMCSFW